MKPLVIYHGNCADGFTAAWLANAALYQRAFGVPPAYLPQEWYADPHPGVYGEPPPAVHKRDVYIVDFSYPLSTLLDMLEKARTITVIDHHATAIKDLSPVIEDTPPRLTLHLSTERSGAYLTSTFFWPDQEPLELVKLVDDRDRWVFADSRTRPFHASLFSRGYTIKEWNDVYRTPIDELVREGEAIDRKHMKDINELIDVMTTWHDIGGYVVPAVNLSYISASDACHELLRRHPEAPFAASWFMRKDGKIVYSLRSRTGSDVDVGAIAQSYGGGGHKHSAGFTT